MAASNSKILALIPARGGSKRIPRKNIIDFFGKPIISYTIAAAKSAAIFDTIHVSTDDEEIKEISRKFGADVSFSRPSELADDHTGILPVAKWVLQEFARRGQNFDTVFILFPCAPLLESKDLKGALDVFNKWHSKRNLLSIARGPVPLEWFYSLGESNQLIPRVPGGAFVRGQDLKETYYETGTFTIFSSDFLLHSENIADDTNYVGYEIAPWKGIDIDTFEDLERAKTLYSLEIQNKSSANT